MGWVASFERRHQLEIKLMKATARSFVRAMAVNPDDVVTWFDSIQQLYGLCPSLGTGDGKYVWNADEVGLALVFAICNENHVLSWLNENKIGIDSFIVVYFTILPFSKTVRGINCLIVVRNMEHG